MYDEQLVNKTIEQIWCIVETYKETLLIGCIYRPTIIKEDGKEASIIKHVERDKYINKAMKVAKKMLTNKKIDSIIVVGDFNFKIKWVQDDQIAIPTGNTTPTEKKFLKTLDECFMYQFVYFPTFQTTDTNSTDTLDLIMAENPNRIFDLKAGPILGKITKAHFTLEFKVAIKNVQKEKFQSDYLAYRHGKYEEMNQYLERVDWSILNGINTQQQYNKILEIYNIVIKSFIP